MRPYRKMLLMSMSMMCWLDCAANTGHSTVHDARVTEHLFALNGTHHVCTHSSTDLDSRSQPVSRQVAAEIMSMLAVPMLPQQSDLHMKSTRCSRPAKYGQLALLLC